MNLILTEAQLKKEEMFVLDLMGNSAVKNKEVSVDFIPKKSFFEIFTRMMLLLSMTSHIQWNSVKLMCY